MSTDAAPLPDDLALCHQIIRDLQREVAELKARLNQNSSNSSKPPSFDPPSVKRAPPKRPTSKKRGGQQGHKPHRRDLVPPEKVNESFDIKPETCRCSDAALLGDDPEPSPCLEGNWHSRRAPRANEHRGQPYSVSVLSRSG